MVMLKTMKQGQGNNKIYKSLSNRSPPPKRRQKYLYT